MKSYGRKGFPENQYANYNLINNAKIDFELYAIENLIDKNIVKYIGWIDFGAVRDISTELSKNREFKIDFLKNGKYNLRAIRFVE